MAERHVVLTGPIRGEVTTSDGMVHDVTPYLIEVPSLAHAQQVADLIGDRYQDEGHPDHMYADKPFVHDKAASFGRDQEA